MQDLDIVPDGTYSVWHGVVTDYAAKWAYGYMVGVGNLLTLPGYGITQGHLGAVEAFGHHLVGVWTDPDTGISYLDRVKHVGALRDALALAREHGELAIWDLREGKTVTVENDNQESIDARQAEGETVLFEQYETVTGRDF